MDDGTRLFPLSFRELAPVPGVTPDKYFHSLIAELGPDLADYREFVLFHGEYIYPEFLIAYRRYQGEKLVKPPS